MSSAKEAVAVKAEIKEEVFIIKEEEKKFDLATVRPLKLEVVNDLPASQAEPVPSTSDAAVAEARAHDPPPGLEFKFNPFNLAPRASRASASPPPAYRAKRRSIPGGHALAKPRLKFEPYQSRR